MRAVLCKSWCEPAGLVVEEVPSPALIAGSVRIAVRAAGVNFADSLIIAGKYQVRPPLPFSPGFEVAGRVAEVGPGVAGLHPGDRVLAVVEYGGFAEEVVVPAENVFLLPAGIDDLTAAGFAVAYGTSHLGLTYKAGLRAEETLLVHGAAGGVGLTAVEIGKVLGARVIASAGGRDKLAIAKTRGADEVIDYRAEDIRERVLALTDGRGADVVYDPVGGMPFAASLRCTRPGGRILIVGFASGTVPQIPANVLLVKNLTVIGYYWGAHRSQAPEALRRSFTQLLDWLAAGRIRPHVSNTYPLADAAAALAALRGRETTGKLVLTTGD
jgi:NADPH2:quinone reductase